MASLLDTIEQYKNSAFDKLAHFATHRMD